MPPMLTTGIKAPSFKLRDADAKVVSLDDFKGKTLVLAFYPADWSPVCGDQLVLYNEMLSLFKKQQAELVGISVDNVWCHKAYATHYNIHFPLLADFEPKGAVSKLYGVYRETDGFSERALFIIDTQGIISWSYLSALLVNPGADGILEALKKI